MMASGHGESLLQDVGVVVTSGEEVRVVECPLMVINLMKTTWWGGGSQGGTGSMFAHRRGAWLAEREREAGGQQVV